MLQQLVLIINLFFARTEQTSVRQNAFLVISTLFFIAVDNLFLPFSSFLSSYTLILVVATLQKLTVFFVENTVFLSC